MVVKDFANMKEVIIDGSKIKDKETFYEEISSKLCARMDDVMDHNLGAFMDVLGDKGIRERGEPMHLVWENYERTKEHVPDDFLTVVIEILDMMEAKDVSYDLK